MVYALVGLMLVPSFLVPQPLPHAAVCSSGSSYHVVLPVVVGASTSSGVEREELVRRCCVFVRVVELRGSTSFGEAGDEVDRKITRAGFVRGGKSDRRRDRGAAGCVFELGQKRLWLDRLARTGPERFF